MSLMKVVFRALNKLGTEFIEPRREDGHGSNAGMPTFTHMANLPTPQSPFHVSDQFRDIEILERQTAVASGVLVFSFAEPVDLVYVYSEDHQNHTAHVSLNGNPDPTPSYGVPLLPGVPQSFPVRVQTVKVYEDAGGMVTVWGYKRV